jgi:hypothetical protein
MENRSIPVKNLLVAFDYSLKKKDNDSSLKVMKICEDQHILDLIYEIRNKLQNHKPFTVQENYFLNTKINLTKPQYDDYNDAIRMIDDSTEKSILDEIKGGFKKSKKSKKSKNSKSNKKSKKTKKRKTMKH